MNSRVLCIGFLAACCLYSAITLAQTAALDERQCIQILQGGAPLADKDAACARLREIGSEASVPALAALLKNPELSHTARFALTGMGAPSAGEALMAALAQTTGSVKVGLIVSLGERRQTNAVAALADALSDSHGQVSRAAAIALGQIGSDEALASLVRFLPLSGGGLRDAFIDSLLACADARIMAGAGTSVTNTLMALIAEDTTHGVKLAAQRCLLRADPARAAEQIAAALLGRDGPAQAAALSLIAETNILRVVQLTGPLLGKLNPELEAALIGSLAQRADPAAVPFIIPRLKASEEGVRLAAISAMGVLGSTDAVPPLLAAAGKASDAAAARLALVQMQGADIDQALMQQLKTAPAAQKTEAARALAERGNRAAVPALITMIDDSPGSAAVPLDALSALARPDNLPQIIALVERAQSPEMASARAAMLQQVLLRWVAARERVDSSPLASSLDGGKPQTRVALLQVCGSLPDPVIAQAFRKALQDPDQNIRNAAAQGLCETTYDALLPDLLAVAKSAPNDATRDRATRAVVRLVTEDAPANASAQWRLQPIKELLAKRPLRVEQGRILLAGLAGVPGTEAFQLAAATLQEPELVTEAARAVVQLATAIPDAASVTPVLKRIAQSQASSQVKAAAEGALKDIEGRAAYLTAWELSGPYRQEGKTYAELFSIPFAPEQEGSRPSWTKYDTARDPAAPHIVDILKVWPAEQCVAYARATFFSKQDQPAIFEIGSDDGIKVWLNAALVHSQNVARPIQPGSDKASVKLRAGNNDILIKLTQNSMGWAFSLRVLLPDGSPLLQTAASQ